MFTLSDPDHGESPGSRRRVATDLFRRGADPTLDELTELAALMSDADYAYIGWIDGGRLQFKSNFGFVATDQPSAMTGCRMVMETGEPLLLADAARDRQFSRHGIEVPGARPCRSYAGVPLVTAGRQAVGTLALLCEEPNHFTQGTLVFLEVLARQAVSHLQMSAHLQLQEHRLADRRRTQQALVFERSFGRATIDAVPGPLAIVDRNGGMVRINQACAQIAGVSVDAAVGKSFAAAVIAPADRRRFAAKLQDAATELAKSGGVFRIEAGLLAVGTAEDPTDSPPRMGWTITTLPRLHPELNYLLVNGRAVEHHSPAEPVSEIPVEESVPEPVAAVAAEPVPAAHELARIEPRALILESLAQPVFAIDDEGRVRYFNAAAGRFFGLEGHDPLGRELRELLRSGQAEAEDSTVADAVMRAMARRETLLNQQAGLPRRDGSAAPVEFSASPLVAGDETVGMAISFREIARSRAPQQDPQDFASLRQQASQSPVSPPADPPQPEFFELPKTGPQQSIPLEPDLIQPDLTGYHVEEASREASVEQNPAPMSADSEWADVSPYPQPGSTYRLRPSFDALTLLQRAAGAAQPEAMRLRVGIRVQGGSLPVRADEAQAFRVLQALVANALRNSPPQTTMSLSAKPAFSTRINTRPIARPNRIGRSSVAATRSSVRKYTHGRSEPEPHFADADAAEAGSAAGDEGITRVPDEVCFIVEDQGPGIEPERLRGILDRFYSTETGGESTSLAMCRSIVEEYGGRIWAQSAVGLGSRFLFTLPAAPRS